MRFCLSGDRYSRASKCYIVFKNHDIDSKEWKDSRVMAS